MNKPLFLAPGALVFGIVMFTLVLTVTLIERRRARGSR